MSKPATVFIPGTGTAVTVGMGATRDTGLSVTVKKPEPSWPLCDRSTPDKVPENFDWKYFYEQSS